MVEKFVVEHRYVGGRNPDAWVDVYWNESQEVAVAEARKRMMDSAPSYEYRIVRKVEEEPLMTQEQLAAMGPLPLDIGILVNIRGWLEDALYVEDECESEDSLLDKFKLISSAEWPDADVILLRERVAKRTKPGTYELRQFVVSVKEIESHIYTKQGPKFKDTTVKSATKARGSKKPIKY